MPLRVQTLAALSLALVAPAACGDSDDVKLVKAGRAPMLAYFQRVLAEGAPAGDVDLACPIFAGSGGARLRARLAHADLLSHLVDPSAPAVDGLKRSLAWRFSDSELGSIDDSYPDPFSSDYATAKWASAIAAQQSRAPLVVAWTNLAGPGQVGEDLGAREHTFSSGLAYVRLSVHDPETGRRLCSTWVHGTNADNVLSSYSGSSDLQGALDNDLAKQTFAQVPAALARIAPDLEVDPSLGSRL